MLSNSDIAELLAQQADRETGILTSAFRRAARSAFLWPVDVIELAKQNRPLTELRGIGPFIQRQIQRWLDRPPKLTKKIPPIRRDFMSLAEARHLLANRPEWSKNLRGDLQMHSTWSDGSGTISEMAEAAQNRSYEYIAITDHSKGLKIAGVIDERSLKQQQKEIAKLNTSISKSGGNLIVLRSIEMNLDRHGQETCPRVRCNAWTWF